VAGLTAKWYSQADLKKPEVLAIVGETAADIDKDFADGIQTVTYSISGNRLTLTYEGDSTQTYTKQ